MATAELDLDRERNKCVFLLGGGELHEPHPDFPDEWDGPAVIAYWYEGLPDYTSASELGLDLDHEVRTAIQFCLFGNPPPPEGWQQMATYSSSGECECWLCGEGTGNEAARVDCNLCDRDGLIYLGDGWAEVVYKRIMSG